MNRLFLGVLAAGMAYAGLIVPDRQYRFCTGEECKLYCGGDKPACRKPGAGQNGFPLVTRQDEVAMAFIEYQANGVPWDPTQFLVAKGVIEEARKQSAGPGEAQGPVSVFIYVHGWKNNAADRGADGDVRRFRDYLREYSKYLKKSEGRQVIGIYLGWRGRSMEAPGWLSWVSFWGRSAAARRVGRGEINDHIDRLLEVAVAGRGKLTAERHPYAFVIGHSFGARVLETAVIGNRPTQVSGACKALAAGTQPVTAPADVVLFENAATSAGYVRRQLKGDCQPCRNTQAGCKDLAAKPNFVESTMTRQPDFNKEHCKASPEDRRCQPYTLFLSVSSSRDWLTRGLLLVAALQHPATFFRRLQTHRAERASRDSTVDPGKDEVFLFQTPPDVQHGKVSAVYMVSRKNTETISAANPVWIFEVGKDISAHHGDVWNKTMLNMLVNLAASDGNMHAPTVVPQSLEAGHRPLKGGVVFQPQ